MALLTLEPFSDYFDTDAEAPAVDPAQTYKLSRFAYLHQDGDDTLIECPKSYARLVVQAPQAAAAFGVVGKGCTAEELAEAVDGLTQEGATEILGVLLHAGMAEAVDADGNTPESQDQVLRSWEFHDLLFHARTRDGRHNYPAGGTYRFMTEFESPPPVKAVAFEETIPLFRPDLDEIIAQDPTLTEVQEARQSVRHYDREKPITLDQLGEFLYRVARIVDFWQLPLRRQGVTKRMTVAQRPYPSGGALYEQEFYVVVNQCDGLESGLYHYDPERHQLGRCCGRTEEVETLIARMAWASNTTPETRQVGIILTARFQRFAWKYASIAYALMLKHAGVVYQTMYLVATAMNLAPSGIGNGNSEVFARAAGTNYYEETSIGEFMLGSKLPPEQTYSLR